MLNYLKLEGVELWYLTRPEAVQSLDIIQPILINQLDCDDEQLVISRSKYGKPFLTPPLENFNCNWSHSARRLLLGLGQLIDVGVDIEYIRPRPRALEIAERFFHPNEYQWLKQLPNNEQMAGFFKLWCAKEALVKAAGYGISIGLNKFCFAMNNDLLTEKSDKTQRLYLSECHPTFGKPWQWNIYLWQPEFDYQTAVVWKNK